MSGFYAGLPASWELIVSSGLIPKPWEREHAVNDLRYHMDLVRLGRVAGLPTRRALEERWGWSWRAVERLVYAPSEWADDRGLPLACSLVEAARGRALKLVGQERARPGPDLGQERASQEPANAINAAEVGQERARPGPDLGQERATRDQDLRARDHRSQITDHRTQDPEEEIRGPQQVEPQPLPARSPQPTEPQKPSPAPKGQVALLAPPPAAPAGPKGKRQSAVPAIREADLQPDEREALLAFRRLLGSMIGQPRCDWVRRPEDEAWLVELVRDLGEAIDVANELVRMQDWLDGHLRRKQAGKSSKFPAMFKPFIRNWLTRQRDEPRHTDRDRDAAYRGVPDGYKPMRMDSNVNYGPRQPHELTEAERAELDRLPF